MSQTDLSAAQLEEVLAELSASGQLFRDGEVDAPVSARKGGGLFTWRKKASHDEPESAAGDKAAAIAPLPTTPTTTPNTMRKPGLFALGRKKASKASVSLASPRRSLSFLPG